MKFSTLAVALIVSTTLVSVSSKKFKGDKLKAKFDFGTNLTATVTVRQTKYDEKNNEADWRVRIKHFNQDLCPLSDGTGPAGQGQLNWHVHQYSGYGIRTEAEGLGASAPACLPTGGHYDPTFACGGASQNNNQDGPLVIPPVICTSETDCGTDNGVYCGGQGYCVLKGGVCKDLRTTDQFPAGTGLVKTDDSYAACKPTNQTSCEIGDQSGKMGKLDSTKRSNQRFTDEWMTPIIDTLKGRSLVLHCCYDNGGELDCSKRLACANLE